MRQLGGAAEVHPSLSSMGLAGADGDGAVIIWPDRGGIAGRYGNDGDFGDDCPQEGSQTPWSDPVGLLLRDSGSPALNIGSLLSRDSTFLLSNVAMTQYDRASISIRGCSRLCH